MNPEFPPAFPPLWLTPPERPTRLRIYNLEVPVKWKTGADAENMESHGVFYDTTQTIEINADRQIRLQADTLLHEIFHALMWHLALNESEDSVKDREEDIVSQLATGLCVVWQLNPEAFKWWAWANA